MKILIVDDDPATVTFMRLAFVSAGHDVTTASSVGEAIGCARDETPDVVLSDLAFGSALGQHLDGGHDGCSFARTLRATPATADVGLLAVSGAGSPDVLRDTTDSGFDGFVSKPVDLAALLDRVDRLGELVATRRTEQDPADHA
ncbi:response regulator [Ilumatobacter sp.]|uniref:response regulator n=1 Tax=Ilumatobacter sp. TaxID=1967498 RepID=UPI003C653162